MSFFGVGPVSGTGGKLFAAATMLAVLLFVAFVAALLAADFWYVWVNADAGRGPDKATLLQKLLEKEIIAATKLSFVTSTIATLVSMAFAIPIGYALSRYRFPGNRLADSMVDLLVVFPPLIVGLSLLVFFQTPAGKWIEANIMKFVYQPAGIVACQFAMAGPLAIRMAKTTFDEINPRYEHVALTLGCTPAGAFARVTLPMARNGIIAGAILTWARSFGIFGPLMVLVGAVRMRTEVLPTTIYLEQSVGRIEVALAVALLMIALALASLICLRFLQTKKAW
ncbi:MAG: ABC transporter permease [Planctomycetota bacterium]|nr:ABC transporter permease [Planctomycetota bacterium]